MHSNLPSTSPSQRPSSALNFLPAAFRHLLVSLLLIYCLFSAPQFSFAQNTVFNGHMEDINQSFCGIVSSSGQFNNILDLWTSPTSASPDVFFRWGIPDSCWNKQLQSTYSGPICLKGPQEPHSGRAMCGIFAFTIDGMNQREYIMSPLTQQTQPGFEYEVGFFVSLADNHEFATDRIGALLTQAPPTLGIGGVLQGTPQVQARQVISDTSGWVYVSDTFVATEIQSYITIGNFFTDQQTSLVTNPGGSTAPGCYGAYYFVDDVSVRRLLPLYAEGPASRSRGFTLITDPTTGALRLRALDADGMRGAVLKLYSIDGKLVREERLPENGDHSIDSFGLPRGMIIVEISIQGQRVFTEKAIVR